LEIYERIKELRKKHLKMSQEEFAARIKISRGNLSNIEIDRVNATDRVVSDICREFNVNEGWLRTGEGEMFRFDPDYDETAVYASELLLEKDNPFYDLIIEIMHTYYDLDPKSQEVIKNSIVKLVENLKKREG